MIQAMVLVSVLVVCAGCLLACVRRVGVRPPARRWDDLDGVHEMRTEPVPSLPMAGAERVAPVGVAPVEAAMPVARAHDLPSWSPPDTDAVVRAGKNRCATTNSGFARFARSTAIRRTPIA